MRIFSKRTLVEYGAKEPHSSQQLYYGIRLYQHQTFAPLQTAIFT